MNGKIFRRILQTGAYSNAMSVNCSLLSKTSGARSKLGGTLSNGGSVAISWSLQLVVLQRLLLRKLSAYTEGPTGTVKDHLGERIDLETQWCPSPWKSLSGSKYQDLSPTSCWGGVAGLTYFIATPPDRGWQRNEGLLLLHSFLSLDILQDFSVLISASLRNPVMLSKSRPSCLERFGRSRKRRRDFVGRMLTASVTSYLQKASIFASTPCIGKKIVASSFWKVAERSWQKALGVFPRPMWMPLGKHFVPMS